MMFDNSCEFSAGFVWFPKTATKFENIFYYKFKAALKGLKDILATCKKIFYLL